MKVLFDSSVLVAGLLESHSAHDESLKYLQDAIEKKYEMILASHSLAETFSVLTSIPSVPKINASMAIKLLDENVTKHAKIISLTAKDYLAAMKNIASLGFSGGAIYDAIIYEAALKASVKQILTLNIRDFQRLNGENQIEIIKP